jgi:RNA-binding protein Musashi
MASYWTVSSWSTKCQVRFFLNRDRSRGFGFVTFTDPLTADMILKKGPHIIDGKQVECKLAIPKDTLSNLEPNNAIFNTRKIFVGGLPPLLSEPQMRDYFEKFGPIEQCVIMHDKPTGKSRGFGFVIYSHENSADILMHHKNQHCIMGKWVDCKRAMPKEVINRDLSQNVKEINQIKNKIYMVGENPYNNHGNFQASSQFSLNNDVFQMGNTGKFHNDHLSINNNIGILNPIQNQSTFPNTNSPINQNWVVNNYCKFLIFNTFSKTLI